MLCLDTSVYCVSPETAERAGWGGGGCAHVDMLNSWQHPRTDLQAKQHVY
jgi:hypothetical protein